MRIACYIVVIAGFVTIVDLCLQAFFPEIANSLGVFIPLIVVNCIILGRAEAFASKNSVAASAVDGICQGIGSKVMDNEATSAGTGALDQFVGKSGAGTRVVKQNIDAVTGATVSTKGVTKGVNAALAAAEAMN